MVVICTGLEDVDKVIYGNFYPSQIKEVIEHPKTFKDISDFCIGRHLV